MISTKETQTARFDARQAVTLANPGFGGGGIFGAGSALGTGGDVDQMRTLEQLRAYTGWSYVAIRRHSEMVAAHFPCVGQLPSSGEEVPLRQSGLTHQKIEHWDRVYRPTIQVAREDVIEIEAHPLITLFRYCNPEDTWADLCGEIDIYLELTGRCYLWVVPSVFTLPSGDPQPAEIIAIPNHWVEPKRDRFSGELLGWIVDVELTGHKLELEPNELIEFKLKSPLSKLGATSPTQATAEWHDASRALDRSQVATLGNQGRPSLILEPDTDVYGSQPLSPDDIDAIKQKAIAQVGPMNQHGTPFVSPPGMKAKPWERTAAEMQLDQRQEQLRDGLFAVRGMSKVVAGLSTEVNRATSEAALVATCENSIVPRHRFIAGCLTEKLAVRWDPRLVVWFEDCAPRDWQREIEETRLDSEIGAITPDERRVARDREPMQTPATETAWIPAGRQPLADLVPPDDGNDDEPDEGDNDDGE